MCGIRTSGCSVGVGKKVGQVVGKKGELELWGGGGLDMDGKC